MSQRLWFTVRQVSYTLVCDGVEKTMLEPGEILYLTLEKGLLRVLDSENDFGDAKQVELRAMTMDAFFRVRPISPELESKDYDDNLKVISRRGFYHPGEPGRYG